MNSSKSSVQIDAPKTTFVGALLPTFAFLTSSAIFMAGFFGNMWLVQMGLMGFGYWRPATFFGLWQVCVKEFCSTITEPTFFDAVPKGWRAVQAFETVGFIIMFISLAFYILRWITTYYKKNLYYLCHFLALGTQIVTGALVLMGIIVCVIVNNHFREMYSEDAPLILSTSFSMATLGGVLFIITGSLTLLLTPVANDLSFRTLMSTIRFKGKSKSDMSDEDKLHTSLSTYEA